MEQEKTEKPEDTDYDQNLYLIDKIYGRILTPDGLRFICASFDYDPEQIGKHMLEMLIKFRNEGTIE